MTSVKGMTWGSPEFVAVAKAAEREGEAKHKVDNLMSELELADMPTDVWYWARDWAADIFELRTN